MMYGYYGHNWMGPGIFGSIFMLILWIIFICVAVRIFRTAGFRNWTTDGVNGSSNRAIDILKERYAKGEIGKDEFEAKKKDLMS